MFMEPDEIDLRLVEALQADCKLSFSELGARVGLSAPSALERVRKLENRPLVEYELDCG